MSTESKCLWGGRFAQSISSNLAELNQSLSEDARLFAEDLDGSKAYAQALARASVITPEECEKICHGLELIRFDWLEKSIQFESTDEDVHTVNERLLVKYCGSVGEKLHTGRSRNDQSVTDVRLWMKRAIHETIGSIGFVVRSVLGLADKYKAVLMPGYTHLQRAQPVLFAHWIFSHAFGLREDCDRFKDLFERVDCLPLGSGAIAGNPLGIDRDYLARQLGFSRISQNSMHAVADRDYIAEFNFVTSMTGVHLSRFAEDLIIYCTKEFNFMKISDAFSTGSSLMPQKRNPDSLELIRGLVGSIFGSMTGFMMTLKGLPSTYNKDLQFDKKSIFASFDSLSQALGVMGGVIETLEVNVDECEKALSPDMLATNWAYYLVKKGIPFRTAHHIVGKCVALAEHTKRTIFELSMEELVGICDKFADDIGDCNNYLRSVEEYNVVGGTSSSSVDVQYGILLKMAENIETCKQINELRGLRI